MVCLKLNIKKELMFVGYDLYKLERKLMLTFHMISKKILNFFFWESERD